jgi:hypothetical protein
MTGRPLTRITPILARLAKLLLDGSFVALDAHMDMENEARSRQKALLCDLGVGDEETRQAHQPT